MYHLRKFRFSLSISSLQIGLQASWIETHELALNYLAIVGGLSRLCMVRTKSRQNEPACLSRLVEGTVTGGDLTTDVWISTGTFTTRSLSQDFQSLHLKMSFDMIGCVPGPVSPYRSNNPHPKPVSRRLEGRRLCFKDTKEELRLNKYSTLRCFVL